jgi:hypothetical protein
MSPPIFTPDGSEVAEIVLPDGSTASEVVAPDGSVVFEGGIPDGLTNRWKIDEGTGSSLADSVGIQPLTTNGATWVSNSKFTGGAALDHDGSDDFTISDNEFGVNNSQFSVAFWINIDSFPNFGRLVSASVNSSPSENVQDGWRIGSDKANRISFIWRDGGSGGGMTGFDTQLDLGEDYFIGANGDFDVAELYVYDSNGQITNDSFSGGSHGAGNDRYLRFLGGANIYVGAVLDDVFVSTTTAWTQSQFETIWEKTKR